MARPYKPGLSYFPFDVGFFEDIKIRKLFAKCGHLGVLIYIYILTLVYRNGYYLEISEEDLTLLIFHEFKDRWLQKVDRVHDVLLMLLQCHLLNSGLYSNSVITSSSIQKQYLLSNARRRTIDKKYWLLSEEEEKTIENLKNSSQKLQVDSTQNEVNVTKTPVIVTKTPVNVAISTQNKNKNKINNTYTSYPYSLKKKEEEEYKGEILKLPKNDPRLDQLKRIMNVYPQAKSEGLLKTWEAYSQVELDDEDVELLIDFLKQLPENYTKNNYKYLPLSSYCFMHDYYYKRFIEERKVAKEQGITNSKLEDIEISDEDFNF